MPLDELHGYSGTNPRPADIDAFWNAGLLEMRKINAAVELVAADFETPAATCYHLYFTGVGGARIHAKFALPKQAKGPVPAVLKFHGYSGHSGDWSDLLPYVAMGWAVAALDCRGQGGLSEDVGGVLGTTWQGHIIRGLIDGPEKLYFRSVFLDAAQLAGIIIEHPDVDQDKVWTTGHSQGGGLSLACAALEPRISKVATHCPFLSDYKRVWELDLLKDAYAELAYFFRRFDPTHARSEEFWERLGYIDIQHLAHRINAEVLLVVGLMDTICPPSTQFALYNKITTAKSLLIYPEFGHETYFGAADKALQFLRCLVPAFDGLD